MLFQDIARLTFIAVRNENIAKKLLTFAGPRAWTTQEVWGFHVFKCLFCFIFLLLLCVTFMWHTAKSVKCQNYSNGIKSNAIKLSPSKLLKYFLWQVITLCERLAGQDANITTVPVSVLKFTRQLTRFFQWTNDVADRLAFSEVVALHFVNTIYKAYLKRLIKIDPMYYITQLLIDPLYIYYSYRPLKWTFFLKTILPSEKENYFSSNRAEGKSQKNSTLVVKPRLDNNRRVLSAAIELQVVYPQLGDSTRVYLQLILS